MHDEILVVSGLPRSGTSMMMQMLQAGGVPLHVDHQRRPDEDNPEGYFEEERVKALARDSSWVAEARGQAIKVISDLLPHLPTTLRYRVVFMRRALDEILASQEKMLARRGEAVEVDRERMRSLAIRHLDETMRWLDGAAHCRTLYVSYNKVLADPVPEVARLVQFLPWEVEAEAMSSRVLERLYRNRAPGG